MDGLLQEINFSLATKKMYKDVMYNIRKCLTPMLIQVTLSLKWQLRLELSSLSDKAKKHYVCDYVT